MDSPEKIQITSSISKFEDSPVFNYLNSLSPIRPMKTIHISQTIHSLTFTSIPSVFTSPHVNNSHKGSRFFTRSNWCDSSRPLDSEAGNRMPSDEPTTEDQDQLRNDKLKIKVSFPLKDPDIEDNKEDRCRNPCYGIEVPSMLEQGPGGHGADQLCETFRCLPESPAGFGPEKRFATKVATESDWDSLITEISFDSPTSKDSLVDADIKYDFSSLDDSKERGMGTNAPQELEDPSSRHEEVTGMKRSRIAQENSAITNDECGREPSRFAERGDLEDLSYLHRGMRRRCLDFEMAGAQEKINSVLISTPSMCDLDDKFSAEDKKQTPTAPGCASSSCFVPSVGLHLNALATTSNDGQNIKNVTSFSGPGFISSPDSFPSWTSHDEVDDSLALVSVDRDNGTHENGVMPADGSNDSASLITDEFSHGSPTKKRRKSEGESEDCKHCNCKKSKCLKLYCECFAAGIYCLNSCSCQECFNKPVHEDVVLATRKQIETRNPLAFAPKVIWCSENVPEVGDDTSKTPASARHKRGCNCKKSNCLKKYCECFQGGVGCSINCRCEGCKNTFGRKDGCMLAEAKVERGDVAEPHEKHETENISHKVESRVNDRTPSSASPAFDPTGPPLSSLSKPPRVTGMGTSGLSNGEKSRKTHVLQTQSKFSKKPKTLPEDDAMPEILKESLSPTPMVKSSSPNSKRISPPHANLPRSLSPGHRSGRRLILQSIPSFPSLTPQH